MGGGGVYCSSSVEDDDDNNVCPTTDGLAALAELVAAAAAFDHSICVLGVAAAVLVLIIRVLLVDVQCYFINPKSPRSFFVACVIV